MFPHVHRGGSYSSQSSYREGVVTPPPSPHLNSSKKATKRASASEQQWFASDTKSVETRGGRRPWTKTYTRPSKVCAVSKADQLRQPRRVDSFPLLGQRQVMATCTPPVHHAAACVSGRASSIASVTSGSRGLRFDPKICASRARDKTTPRAKRRNAASWEGGVLRSSQPPLI